MTTKDPNVFLSHARDCLERAMRFAQEGKQAFLHDEKTHDAILRNLEIIGQCIKDAGIETMEARCPEFPWRRVAAFRNVLAHAYLAIKPEMIWSIIENELPALQQALNKLLENWEP